MYRIAVCDSNVVDAQELVNKLQHLAADLHFECSVESFRTARAFAEAFKARPFPLVFLETEIGGTNGIELAKRIRFHDKDTEFIFVTSHAEYALAAYAVFPVGYILKSVTKQKLHEPFLRAVRKEKREFPKLLIDTADGGETINRFFSGRKCDNMFFRGAFLASGFVNPPDKPGRVELSTVDADVACDSATALTRHFRLPKLSVRRGNQIIYYRDTESIEYFLSYIGANKAAFAIINAQMLKEKTNEVNRKKNCDIANITKSITASGIYVDAILALMESGDFDKLSPELKQTAKLRLENDTLTLSELAALENPPISKSQVSKRLQKIYSLYKSLQQAE